MQKKIQILTANRLFPFAKRVQQLLAVLFFAIVFVFPTNAKAETRMQNLDIGSSPNFYLQNMYATTTSANGMCNSNSDQVVISAYFGDYNTGTLISTTSPQACSSYSYPMWLPISQNASTTGNYYIKVASTTPQYTFWGSFSWNGSSIASSTSNTDTRVIASDPANGQIINTLVGEPTATSSDNVEISLDTYFNTAIDGGFIDRVCIDLQPIENPNISLAPICELLTTSGGATYNFDFGELLHGQYYAIAYFTNGVDIGTHFFTYTFTFTNMYSEVPNQSCLYGSTLGVCNNISGLPDGYATTTLARNWGMPLANCDNLSGLDKVQCGLINVTKSSINFLFVPNGDQYTEMIQDIKDNALTHFPLGYVTDFVTKLSTTTVGSLTVLDITIPNGMVGTGSNLTLDLTGVLDDILNATSSVFSGSNPETDSTETFFEITNYYWKIICYLGAVLYMLRRIFGTHVIPHQENKIA